VVILPNLLMVRKDTVTPGSQERKRSPAPRSREIADRYERNQPVPRR
jgi:hypothetical protein